MSGSNNGYYQSINNTVSWDKNTTGALAEIAPSDAGDVTLLVGALGDAATVRSLKNPHIDVHLEMRGNRSGQDIAPVISTQDITIKLESVLTFSAKAYRNYGSIVNTGPIPPRADMESTYTATFTLTNTTNNLAGTLVTAVLPQGVTWKGESTPATERVSYNPDTRTVTWNVGNISSGAGFTLSAKEVSFKIGIVPNVTQISNTPTLLTNISAVATDTYTNTTLQQGAQNITTRFSDPGFVSGNEVVVK